MHQPSQLIRLSDLSQGLPARLTQIHGGRHLTRRLLALGLRQGSSLCVVQRRGQGLVLACGDARVAVGAGIAEKLWVTLEETEGGCPPRDSEEEVDGLPSEASLGLSSSSAS